MAEIRASEQLAGPIADSLEAFQKSWRYKLGLLLIIWLCITGFVDGDIDNVKVRRY